MLTRINGIAFRTQEELDEHLKLLEEAARRDHRKIGKEMQLFMFVDEAPGFPFFLPNGMILKNTLIDYWREIHSKAGYVEVSTPMIMSRKLWETSGHWDHYKDNMYATKIDDEDYCIKPMNCPGGVLVYRSQPHSYRELPCAWVSWAWSTATSCAAPCTACSVCAASPRTMPTSLSVPTRSPTRS